MKIKLIDVQRGQQVWSKIGQKNFSAKLAFRIMRFMRELETTLKDIDAIREKLVMELGEEKDGKVSIVPDKLNEFHTRMTELLDEEVEIPDLNVKLDDLDGVEFTPVEMMALEPFITE
jgi:hypothetical protein